MKNKLLPTVLAFLSLSYLSHSLIAPIIVSINFPVGVDVSIFSFKEISVILHFSSVSIIFNKSAVERLKRLKSFITGRKSGMVRIP